MLARWLPLLPLLALLGCSGPPEPICGEGEDPVIITGLVGTIDGEPVVEVQLVVPDTCEVRGETWMFWDEETDTVTLGSEPTSGDLLGDGIETDPRLIFFRNLNLGVRLEYPDDEVSDEVTLAWFSEATDLAAVHCAEAAGTLECDVLP